MKIAVGNKRTSTKWVNQDITWDDFCDRIATPIRTTESVAEYHKMPKSQKDDIKDVGGFVAGHLKGGRRQRVNVYSRSMVTLDMDYAKEDSWEELTLLFPYRCLLYSTHSHTKDNPRYRLIIPLSRDVQPEEYGAVSRMLAKEIGIDLFDVTTYDVERLMYWPSVSKDGDYICEIQDGAMLNPDDVLSKYDDWTDITTWPVSSKESQIIQKTTTTQKDPLNKDGIVGAFCRTYTITDVMEKFLYDVYEPSTIPNRYDHIGSQSSAGVVVYEDKFAYSHHATDPAGGKLLNAFDLVRIHKFGWDEDKKSFQNMVSFALQNEDVKLELAIQKRKEAEDDFSEESRDVEWMKKLKYQAKSQVLENSVWNLVLILENDMDFRHFGYNQLANRIQITGTVPWERPDYNPYWRDADTAQLKALIDVRYIPFSTRNHDIAFIKVAEDRAFHPIRDYFNNLPEWDNVERLETLLIDYFGASDDGYVRSVTRKTFVAAVARVFAPSVKFDSVLILNGTQGIGKSTFFSKLAGEWFSDSLALTDMKDKAGAEKLQGYWILELGELAGMKKADIETVKSFISRTDDSYRPSYGKFVENHPRQCIIVGSTNSETGFLRDITGNRRFWPVKVTGKSHKKSWQLTDEDVAQIWAEAWHYYIKKEPLYLTEDISVLAMQEQTEAMETDEREGLVQAYLNTLLPDNWDSMSLYERKNYLHDDLTSKEGTVIRQTVCNMEIWCECFGKDSASMKKSDSYEVSAIMQKIGGWKKGNRQSVPLYGQQRVYIRS
ncbi:TPA: hypothetical protein TXT63_000725 [Streptococcus suis]|nr:hypothetical protein [Streptococcus suis]